MYVSVCLRKAQMVLYVVAAARLIPSHGRRLAPPPQSRLAAGQRQVAETEGTTHALGLPRPRRTSSPRTGGRRALGLPRPKRWLSEAGTAGDDSCRANDATELEYCGDDESLERHACTKQTESELAVSVSLCHPWGTLNIPEAWPRLCLSLRCRSRCATHGAR